MYVLIPDFLSNPGFLAEAMTDLNLPGLESLLFSAKPVGREALTEAASREVMRSTPAWRWLYTTAGRIVTCRNCAPHATAWIHNERLTPAQATWHLAAPCHIAATSDQLLLAGLANQVDALQLNKSDAHALAASCAELLPEGAQLQVLSPECWAIQCSTLDALLTSEPACAMGRNIDRWLPADDSTGTGAARAWRRLHNEIQMTWHIHPVNAAREHQGVLPINALWLYGSGNLQDLPPRKWQHIATDLHDTQLEALAHAWNAAYEVCDGANGDSTAFLKRTHAADTLLWLGGLSRATVTENIDAWRSAMLSMDQRWLQPLANSGTEICLVLCSEHDWRTLRTAGTPAWKRRLAFWRRVSPFQELST